MWEGVSARGACRFGPIIIILCFLCCVVALSGHALLPNRDSPAVRGDACGRSGRGLRSNNSVVEVEVVLPVEVMAVETLNKRSRSPSPPVMEPAEVCVCVCVQESVMMIS